MAAIRRRSWLHGGGGANCGCTPVVFGPWERRDGVRKGMVESRKGAVRPVLARRGRERRPEQCSAAVVHGEDAPGDLELGQKRIKTLGAAPGQGGEGRRGLRVRE